MKQRFKVELEQETWHRTRARAIQQGVTAGSVVEEALRAYLEPAGRAATVATSVVAAVRETATPLPIAAAITQAAEIATVDDELDGLDDQPHATFSPVPKPRSESRRATNFTRPPR